MPLPRLSRLRLDQLKAAHLDHCYAELLAKGLSQRSVEQAHTILRAALRHAAKTGLLATSPTFGATPPRSKRREMQTLTPEQVQQHFEQSTSDRLHALYVVLTTAGLRIGEALTLTWDDVDWDVGRLSLRRSLKKIKGAGLVVDEMKTAHSRRTVHLAPWVVDVLQHHEDRHDFEKQKAAELYDDRRLVFCGETGGPLHSSNIHKYLQKHLRAAGLPRIRVHDLRHTCATLLLQRGVHPKMVQELLGHSSITLTLDTYSHIIPAMHGAVASHMDALFGAARAGR